MTNEEAARILDTDTSMDAFKETASTCTTIEEVEDTWKEKVVIAREIGAAALRERIERENPKPLTLDELREIPWREPVWVSAFDGGGRLCSTWCHLRGQSERLFEDKFIAPLEYYGKTWLAYRYEPKEART